MIKPNRVAAALAVVSVGVGAALAQDTAENMSFFVTSSNPGNGGDLGGLEGADAHCQSLAEAAGAGDRTWRAYLSTDSEDARDRIGDGPWHNAAGDMIAESVEDLHSEDNNLTAETALNERGESPNYIGGPQPLQHDVLTGTNEDGTAADLTCNNWTDGSSDAQAMLGHADRLGREPGVNSWNAVHPSQGCDLPSLERTGGAGMFYCFAAD
ncbi:MAG: DUF1554 domain-containing protein [Gammaproteobacteria bacterium]|nr:DUF1554 domain-containing protein [Gammaproteobacteria bacterium]